jgi:hypothetical protein
LSSGTCAKREREESLNSDLKNNYQNQKHTNTMEQHEIDGLTILERAALPTPKFFRYLKLVGLTLAAASGALLTAPVSLPAIIITIAGYVAVAATVTTAISQVTVES